MEPSHVGCAANYGVPVSVHWEIGLTDVDPSTGELLTSPQDNWRHLLWLLRRFPTESEVLDPADPRATDPRGVVHDYLWDVGEYGVGGDDAYAPLKLILCHCGLGPVNAVLGLELSDDATRWADYKIRISHLLETYPWVYFDIAGLQLGLQTGTTREPVWRLYDPTLPDVEPTEIGRWLLETMSVWPGRFLFGTDADNRVDADTDESYGIDTYLDSVDMYLEFLQYGVDNGYLTDANVEAILYGNAQEILYAHA
jgi:hypothetical protein